MDPRRQMNRRQRRQQKRKQDAQRARLRQLRRGDELQLQIFRASGQVNLSFGRRIDGFAMEEGASRGLAEKLLKHAELLYYERTGADNPQLVRVDGDRVLLNAITGFLDPGKAHILGQALMSAAAEALENAKIGKGATEEFVAGPVPVELVDSSRPGEEEAADG